MGLVTDVKNNILTRVALVLGADYSQLAYVNDVSQNKFKGASKRYGVLPGSANETSGTNQYVTLDHQFQVILTDSYQAGPDSQINDNLKAERINELQDKALAIYKDLATHKSLISASCLIINNLSIESIEFLEDEKVAVQRLNFNVKYRQQI